MIQSSAQKIAFRIKKVVPDHPASAEVLTFSIAALLNVTSIIIITLVISIFTGRTTEALIGLIAFAVLRQLSGGYHLPSSDLCVLVSVTGITGVSLLNFSSEVNLYLTASSFLLVILFAPTDIEKQSRIPRKYYPLLKVASSVLVLSNFVIGSTIIAVSFLIQSITLIRLKGGESSEKN